MSVCCPLCGSRESNRRRDDGRCFVCYQAQRSRPRKTSAKWACVSCGLLCTLSPALLTNKRWPCARCKGAVRPVLERLESDDSRQGVLWAGAR